MQGNAIEKHSILLIQKDAGIGSRLWADFPNVSLAIEELIGMYEDDLRKKFPNRQQIDYGTKELFQFLDDLSDVAILVFDPKSKDYTPHDAEWIKTIMTRMLQKQA